MKRLIVLACVAILGMWHLVVAEKRTPLRSEIENTGAAARPAGKLIVHEWGTFTGFAGSDGVHLPFNTIVGSDLPPFVSNRDVKAALDDPKLEILQSFRKGGGGAALQRMETPVVFFYAQAAAEVNVRVDFPQGTLTEFYPPVRSIAPRYGEGFGELAYRRPTAPGTPGAGPQTRPAESFLNWGNIRIVPHPSGSEGKLIPVIADASRYSFARNTDAALVQVSDTNGVRYEEKFLFYRGLGNFILPVTLRALGGDRFELANACPSPIASAFLVQIDRDDQKTARFARFDNCAANQQLTLPSADRPLNELSDAIGNSLIAGGLYEKEARAMLETWKSTWLDEPGTRLLYIVPRPVTDTLLPLHIAPEPQRTVRVLVGRIDILTPQREARIRAMMLAANAGVELSADDAAMLRGLGRFLAPAIERTSKLTGDVYNYQARRLYAAWSRAQARQK